MAAVDIASVRHILEKLYPWKLVGYDPDFPQLSSERREACQHEWHEMPPSGGLAGAAGLAMVRICSGCGRVEGRMHPYETPAQFLDRVAHDGECQACDGTGRAP